MIPSPGQKSATPGYRSVEENLQVLGHGQRLELLLQLDISVGANRLRVRLCDLEMLHAFVQDSIVEMQYMTVPRIRERMSYAIFCPLPQ